MPARWLRCLTLQASRLARAATTYVCEQGTVSTDGVPDPGNTNYACEQGAVSIPCTDGAPDPGLKLNMADGVVTMSTRPLVSDFPCLNCYMGGTSGAQLMCFA